MVKEYLVAAPAKAPTKKTVVKKVPAKKAKAAAKPTLEDEDDELELEGDDSDGDDAAENERPAKKIASKGRKQEKKAAKKTAAPTRKEIINSLIASTNAAYKGQVLQRASETKTSYLLRRPTGVLSLDIALAGGWPAGALCLLSGPDGAGKDLLLNYSIAQQQRLQGKDSAAVILGTEFKYDKPFARDYCGVQVALTKDEIDEVNQGRDIKGLPLLTLEERHEYQKQVGEILLLQGLIMDDALDILLDCIAANTFQLAFINSLGVMQTAAKEEKSAKEGLSAHATQSNEAQLLSRFMPMLFTCLNRASHDGHANETAILATSQVRAERDLPRARPGMRLAEKQKYKTGSGSWALKHGKAIELMLHKGTKFFDKSVSPPMVMGNEIQWETKKGKLGTHEGLRGQFDFYFGDGLDTLADLIKTAIEYDVIEQGGAWYSYTTKDGEDIRGQGIDKFRRHLVFNEELQMEIREETMRAAEVVCVY